MSGSNFDAIGGARIDPVTGAVYYVQGTSTTTSRTTAPATSATTAIPATAQHFVYSNGVLRVLAGMRVDGSITLANDPTSSMQVATKRYVDNALSNSGPDTSVFLTRSGGPMTGPLVLHGAPTEALGAATKSYVDTRVLGYLPTTGGALSGALTLPGPPSAALHAATKSYVDLAVSGVDPTLYVLKTGSTLTGHLTLASSSPVSALHAASKGYVDAKVASGGTDLSGYMARSGSTMTGLLTLSGNPVQDAHAATKGYVDTAVLGYLPRSGGTMLGNLLLNGDPTTPTQAATKAYVDATAGDALFRSGGIMTGPLTLNGPPTAGAHASTKTYVDNAVAASLSRNGGTMLGALTLSGDPSLSSQAATKNYVDLAVAPYLLKSGGTLTGLLTLSGTPTLGSHAATKTYVDDEAAKALPRSGGAMTGPLSLVDDPINPLHAATKQYADAIPRRTRTINLTADVPTTSDIGGMLLCTAAGTVAITANDLGAGASYRVTQMGTGQVTIVAGAGVTLISDKSTPQYSTAMRGAVLTVVCDGAGRVGVTGNTAAGTTGLYSGTLALTAQPASRRVYQRDSRSGSVFNKGAGTVTLTINPTAAITSLEYRVLNFDTLETLVDWTAAASNLSSGSQSLTLTLPAQAAWYRVDLRPNGDTGKMVSTTNRFGVGEIIAVAGQSLAVDFLHPRHNNTTMSLTNLGIIPSAFGVVHATVADSNGTPLFAASWANPADATNYNSGGSAEFLNRAVTLSGVCCAVVGHAVADATIASFASGQANRNQLHSVITAAGGKIGTFLWMHGHADALAGTTSAAYQNALATLISSFTANYPGVAIKSLLAPIPSITASTQGTPAQILAIRGAHLAYAAPRTTTTQVVDMFDAGLHDGIHFTQQGQTIAARHLARAFAKAIGAASTSAAGPVITGASRASGSAVIRLTVAQTSGTALVSTGTPSALFRVYAATNTNAPLAIASVTLVSPTAIDITLATAPADTQVLDIWYRRPLDTTLSATSAIYDNAIADGIGINGRLLSYTTTAPIQAAAPGSPSTVWAPSSLGTALLFAADTNNTASTPSDGSALQDIYTATKKLVQTNVSARPAISATGGVGSNKRVLTYTAGAYLHAEGNHPALVNLFDGNEQTTNATYIIAARVTNGAGGFSYLGNWSNTGANIAQLAQNGSNMAFTINGTTAANAVRLSEWQCLTIIKNGPNLILRANGVQIGAKSISGSAVLDFTKFALGAFDSAGTPTTGHPPAATAGMIVTNTALSGDNLLAAEQWVSATAGLAVTTQPPVTPVGDDLAFAEAFKADLIMGVNIERHAAAMVTPAYCTSLKANGLTHIRVFPYSSATLGFYSRAQMAVYYDVIAMAIAAGLKVLIDLQDECTSAALADAATEPYIRECLSDIAARNFDPTKLAVGYAARLIGGSNADFNPHNVKYAAIMRSYLPNFCLLMGAAGASNPNSLTDGTLTVHADKRMLYQWQHYDWNATVPAAWESVATAVSTWASAQNVVTICGEFGIGSADNSAASNYTTFASVISAFAAGAPEAAGLMWAVTTGGWWRLNVSPTDLTLRSEIASAFQTAAADLGLIIAPPEPSIALSNSTPGTRAAGAWTTQIIANVPTTWVVMNAANAQVGTPVSIAGTGTTTVAPNFTTTGQYLRVWQTSNNGYMINSSAVIIAVPSISINPTTPGLRAAGTWAVTITANAPTTWAVINTDYSLASAATQISSTGTTAIAPNFTTTGQMLRVWQTSNPGYVVYSDPVTIEAAPQPTGTVAIPDGWVQVFADDFTMPATTGPNALDANKWGHRDYGSGGAHQEAARWNNGNNIESTGSTVRIHTKLVGGIWRVDGFQQGVQTTNPGGYAYHPGYDEFHFRCRFRYSHLYAPGVGGYLLMWDANDVWGSEIDMLEMPDDGEGKKTRAEATMHWDPSGGYNLDIPQNHEYTNATRTGIDLSQWRVIECRRTYWTDGDGIKHATIRVWLDGEEVGPEANWINNRWLTARMVFGPASFVGNAAGVRGWYGSTRDGSGGSAATPPDSYLELDYVEGFAPGDGVPEGGGTTGGSVEPPPPPPSSGEPSVALSDSNPGTRPAGVWNTSIIANVATSWVVADANNEWRTEVNLVTTTGTTAIAPEFVASQDYLMVWQTSNPNYIIYSEDVTISGTAPPPEEPTVPSLALSNDTPGTRDAGIWNTSIIANVPTRWVVIDVNNEWRTDFNNVPGTGTTPIEPEFVATGDYLMVWVTADANRAVYSEPVTLTGDAPPPDPEPVTPSIMFSVANPGNRQAGIWNTSIIANVPTSWVVMTVDHVYRTGENLITGTGTTPIQPEFVATGDYVMVWMTANPEIVEYSGEVTIIP